MRLNEINSWMLFYASLILIIIELLSVVVISRTGIQPLPLIGIARITESAFLLFIVIRLTGDLKPIGLNRNKVAGGIKKGLVWSAGFGMSSALAIGILYFFNFNLLKIFSLPPTASLYGLLLLFIVGGFLSPIAEEIFFRGMVYGFLRRWGILPAILGSTLLFCLVHALITGVSFIQVIGGLIFAIAYEMEKNLIVPITIHVLGNMAIFSLSLLMSL